MKKIFPLLGVGILLLGVLSFVIVSQKPTKVQQRASGSITYNNEGVTGDSYASLGNFDGSGNSYSLNALNGVGFNSGGTTMVKGIVFQLPTIQKGNKDNLAAAGQVIPVIPGGNTLGILGAASNGPSSGTATITYLDNSTQIFTLSFSDWTLNRDTSSILPNNISVFKTTYRNTPTGQQTRDVNIFFTSVILQQGKVIRSITLPTTVDKGQLHIFAIATSAGPTPTPTLTPSPTSIPPTPTKVMSTPTPAPTSITPIPTCTPMPPQCQPGSPLGANCPNPPPGGWCPISPTPTISPTITPTPTCISTLPTCPPGSQCPISNSCPTPTPIITGVSTASIQVSFSVLGIPDSSNSAIPLHNTRTGSIDFIDANNTSHPINTKFQFDNTNGVFTTTVQAAVAPGIYLPKIDVPGYLHKALPLVTITQTSATPNTYSATVVNGDIDADNSIDILDFQRLFDCYNKTVADKPKCAGADLNDDGKIDAVDFNIFLRSFSTQHGD